MITVQQMIHKLQEIVANNVEAAEFPIAFYDNDHGPGRIPNDVSLAKSTKLESHNNLLVIDNRNTIALDNNCVLIQQRW